MEKIEGKTISQLEEKLNFSGDEFIPIEDSQGTWKGRTGNFVKKSDIATINGQSIIGVDNIDIKGDSGVVETDKTLNVNSDNAISNKAVTTKINEMEGNIKKANNVYVGNSPTPPSDINAQVYFEINDKEDIPDSGGDSHPDSGGETTSDIPEVPNDGQSYVRSHGLWKVGMSKSEIIDKIGSGGSIGSKTDTYYDKYIENALCQIKRSPRTENSVQGNVFTIAFSSDFHYDIDNLRQYINFCDKYKNYIDCELCVGDVINFYWSAQGESFDNWTNTSGSEKILISVGNHDTWGNTWNDTIDKKTVYDRIFAPSIMEWGVEQPKNASDEGLMYYYKDYGSIRIIVLDCMYWDKKEKDWLNDVLLDARINVMHVICASHYCPKHLSTIDSPFTSLMPPALNTTLNEEAVDEVASFIDNGGRFITWLCGHIHRDYISVVENHQDQLVIHIACASSISGQTAYCDSERKVGTIGQNAFDILGIDLYNDTIRILRVGDNMDSWMRERNTIAINYNYKKIIQ